MKITAVVFDFGGVMTSSTKPERVIKLAEEKNIPWEIFEKGYAKHRLQYDGDFLTLRELYDLIWKDAGIEVDDTTTELFMKEDSASWLSRRARTYEWMRSLKERGFKIGILTNMNSVFGNVHFKKEYREYIELADAMVISGEEHIYKPMPEIYELMQQRIAVPAEEICFIDDVEKNIAAAEACGWNGIRFLSNAQVEEDFEKLMKR